MAPLTTPYQRYHWILPWQMHSGKRNGVTPFLVYGGVVGGRFCGIFNSMIQGNLARKTPGADDQSHTDVLSEGLTQFDLDVGEARFKRLFCTEIEPLFDTFRPLTARGSIAALGYRLKSKIKRSPAIWDALTILRRRSKSLRRSARRRRPQQSTSGCGDVRT